MGALDDLAAYLVLGDAQKKAIAENDPYAGGAEIGNTLLGYIAGPQSKEFDTKDRMVGAALSGLLGGVFGGLSDSYRGRAANDYTDVIAKSILGQQVERPDTLSPSLFSDAGQRASIFKIQSALEDRKLMQNLASQLKLEDIKSQNDLEKSIAVEIAKNPYKKDKILGALRDLNTAVGNQPNEGTPSKESEPIAQSPYEAALDKYEGDEELARSAVKRDMEAPDRLRDIADSLRKEFYAKPEVKNLSEVSTRYQALQKALTDPSAISDTDFSISIAKIFDPASVVRETESGAIVDSQSIPSSILGTINKALGGGAKLDQQTRQAILRAAGRHYETQKAVVDLMGNEYSRIAKERGVNPNDVIMPQQAIQPAPVGTPTAASQPTTTTPSADEARAILRARGVPGY